MANATIDPESRKLLLTKQVNDLINGLKLKGTASTGLNQNNKIVPNAGLNQNNKIVPNAELGASYTKRVGKNLTGTASGSVGTDVPAKVGVKLSRPVSF